MTSSSQIGPAVDKLVINLGRIDGLVNGNASATVATDSAVLPSFANLQAQLTQNNSGPVSITTFGAVGDGATNNAAALMAFNTWARARSAAGYGVELYVPPGTYNFNHSQCQGFLRNIKRLQIVGYGATFQNTYDKNISGANFGYELPWGGAVAALRDASNTEKNWFINTTAQGDTSITTTTHADASSSNFAVGDWVMVASLDIQYFGFPPNVDQFEFVKVVSFNNSTGVIAIDRPLRYAHRSDFPDGPNGIIKCGKARVWQLNTTGWPQGGPLWPNNGLVTWDIDHTYEGITVNRAPNSTSGYVSFNGRRIRTINWTGAGHSESTAGIVIHENGTFLQECEPDKLVESIEYRNCSWAVDIGFQSSSIDSVVFVNPNSRGLACGNAKHVVVDGGHIDSLSVGGVSYGPNRSTIIRSAFVRNFEQMHNVPTSNGNASIGGDVTYANGVFKIAQTFAGQQGNWNVKPGSQLWLKTTNGVFPKDIGMGTVVSITEDASFIYITTTLPYASLPAWASGDQVNIIRGGVEMYEGCTGCDGIVLASQASQAGHNTWDYFRYVWAGVTATSGDFFPGFHGQPEKITIDVKQAAPLGSCTLKFENFALASPTTPTTSLGDFQIITDISTVGKRVLTRQTWFNKQTNDAMTLGGVGQSVLPTGLMGQCFWNVTGYTPNSYQPYQLPIIEMIWETDLGQYRKLIPAFSSPGGGGPATIANITGTFQA